jgi:hypothetical protein
MGMFETQGKAVGGEIRKPGTIEKLVRMNKTLSHEEADRVPISDFFWGSFVEQWRRDLDLPPDANPYFYYDLDWIATVPNMDPWIRPFETLRETEKEVVVKTGFGAIMRKKYDTPMPEMMDWEINEIEKLELADFDDPADRRRYYEGGDNQIAGVGDGFERDSPPWIDTVKSLHPDIVVYGSMIEVSECLTRLVGQQNALLWMGLYPDRMGAVINRIGAFYLECAKAELEAGKDVLDGFVIWGDVAYKPGLFFSPDYWREYFKPWVKAIVEEAHRYNLPVIYHGCGCVKAIFEDYIEIGVDGYNPLEVKAGMDVIELRRDYGHRMTFVGNSDIQVWERGDPEEVKKEVLYRLNAAKGGGYIFQSDHSVAGDVSGKTYDTIVKLVREYGKYPLDLGEYDEEI